MNKVTFKNGFIFQNGICVGQISGRGEVYVTLYTPEQRAQWANTVATQGYQPNIWEAKFVARYKYSSPSAGAKHFVKWALSQFSPEEVLARQGEHGGTAWASDLGYVSYNALKARKLA